MEYFLHVFARGDAAMTHIKSSLICTKDLRRLHQQFRPHSVDHTGFLVHSLKEEAIHETRHHRCPCLSRAYCFIKVSNRELAVFLRMVSLFCIVFSIGSLWSAVGAFSRRGVIFSRKKFVVKFERSPPYWYVGSVSKTFQYSRSISLATMLWNRVWTKLEVNICFYPSAS